MKAWIWIRLIAFFLFLIIAQTEYFSQAYLLVIFLIGVFAEFLVEVQQQNSARLKELLVKTIDDQLFFSMVFVLLVPMGLPAWVSVALISLEYSFLGLRSVVAENSPSKLESIKNVSHLVTTTLVLALLPYHSQVIDLLYINLVVATFIFVQCFNQGKNVLVRDM